MGHCMAKTVIWCLASRIATDLSSDLSANIYLEGPQMTIQRETSLTQEAFAPTLLEVGCYGRVLEPGSGALCSTPSLMPSAHKTQTDIMPAHK